MKLKLYPNDLFVFGGHDLCKLVNVSSITRTLCNDRTIESTAVKGNHGTIFHGVTDEGADVTVRALLLGDTIEERDKGLQEVAKKLYSQELRQLVLRDYPDTYMNAILQSSNIEKAGRAAWLDLTFHAPDGVRYARTISSERGTSKVSFVPQGVLAVRPVLEIHAEAQQGLLTVEYENGRKERKAIRLNLPRALRKTDTLRIDAEERQVYVNREPRSEWLTLDSSFLECAPGFPHSVAIPNADIWIEWREKWI